MKPIENERIIYVDILRILSMIAVIVLHVASTKLNEVKITEIEWQVFNFFDSICRWCVPIFVMISGMFLLDEKKEINIKRIYTKYVKKILIILFSWNFLYAVAPYIYREHFEVKEFIYNLILGPMHMWFLYMIIALYMITPFLRKIVQDEKLTKYFLILWFVFAIIFRTIIEIFSIDLLNEVIFNKMYFYFILGYSGYFVLGYFIKEKQFNKKINALIYILGIIGFLITAVGTYICSMESNKTYLSLYGYLTPNVLAMSLAIFVFIKNTFSCKKLKIGNINLINKFSKCSLGVYLVHILVISVLTKLNIDVLKFNPFVGVILISTIVFLLSYVISIILNKIKFVNKYFV